MFTIKLTARAKRELKSISKRHRESIGEIFEELKDDPYIGKSLTRKYLGKFSYKIGVFRLIYQINSQNKTVRIITAGHRSTIYS